MRLTAVVCRSPGLSVFFVSSNKFVKFKNIFYCFETTIFMTTFSNPSKQMMSIRFERDYMKVFVL